MEPNIPANVHTCDEVLGFHFLFRVFEQLNNLQVLRKKCLFFMFRPTPPDAIRAFGVDLLLPILQNKKIHFRFVKGLRMAKAEKRYCVQRKSMLKY